MGDLRIIRRAAVGRVARLGDLYDARKDKFICMRDLRDVLKKKGVCETKKDESEDEEYMSGVGFLISNSDNESGPNSEHDSSFDAHCNAKKGKCLGANALVEPMNKAKIYEEESKSPAGNTTDLKNEKFEKRDPGSRLDQSSGKNFDAKKERHLNANVFKEPLSEENILEEDTMERDISLNETNTLREQFERLGIEKELSLSIMSSMVNLRGSSAYLNSQYSSGKLAHMTLTYTVNAMYQNAPWVPSMLDTDYRACKDATHFVCGIFWGAKCNITCEYHSSRNDTEEQVKEKLQEEINRLKMALSVEDNAMVHSSKNFDVDDASNFSYHIKSDLENDVTTTFQGAIDAVASLEKAVLEKNVGKGVPIAYEMWPFSSFRKKYKLKINSGAVFKQIEEGAVDKIFQTMQTARKNRQQINDVIETFNKNEDAVSSTDLEAAKSLLNSFDIEEAKFKSDLARALFETRSGNENLILTLDDVLKSFHDRECSPDKIIASIKKYDGTVHKLKVINEFKDKNVSYFGKRGSIEEILGTADIVYALYMDHQESNTCFEEWEKQIALLSRLVTAHENDNGVRLAIVDCEFHQRPAGKNSMRIQLYHKERGWEDLPQGVDENIEECIIDMAVEGPFEQKSKKLVMFEISCPKSFDGICQKDECQWICRQCKEVIEYGIDDDCLYCRCGKASRFKVKFRCNGLQHGLSYADFHSSRMREVLYSWKRAIKETNILIMGETGVGKSTWINAIANYFAFPTLEHAIDANDVKVCIPCSFSFTSQTGNRQTISVGAESKNEVQEAGQSATQMPRAYRFDIGKQLITLLDTPGLADVRGIEQDKINMENVLGHLSHYDEIHGICFLLKANQSRLTASFRFCVMELLRHLHKSAVDNIVFCFTHTGGKSRQQGDSLPTLEVLLKGLEGPRIPFSEANQFFFENDSFKCLAGMKNGIEFTQQEIGDYSSSWEKSMEETSRLINHVKTLSPHKIKDTVSLNNARRKILELSKPLTETAANIQENVDRADKKHRELNASEEEARTLQDQLHLDVFKLVHTRLERPRTVCTHKSCVKYVQDEDGNQKISYEKPCHEPCTLPFVEAETVGRFGMIFCRKMLFGRRCKECGHSWKCHMQISYELKRKRERVIDKDTQKLLNENQNSKAALDNFIKDLDTYIEELENEQAVITNICAQFGCYLKENSITPFNDAVDSHLDMLIWQEEGKCPPNEKAIKNLKGMKEKYQQ